MHDNEYLVSILQSSHPFVFIVLLTSIVSTIYIHLSLSVNSRVSINSDYLELLGLLIIQ